MKMKESVHLTEEFSKSSTLKEEHCPNDTYITALDMYHVIVPCYPHQLPYVKMLFLGATYPSVCEEKSFI